MEYISGVKVRKLRLIADDRGWLMEMLRSDWEEFERFGQTYVTACYPGVVKAWHYHKNQTDHFICVPAKTPLRRGWSTSSSWAP
jgi:dTDP-4-dehydrorhamnose 3,5-epimerase